MSRRSFFVVAYLDYFLIILESEHECWTVFWELITLLDRLGLTVNWNKVVYPCQRPSTYLGIEIDSKRRQLRLPDHKLREIRTLLSQTLAKTEFTKRELQSLAGKLKFAARVVYGGRTFLQQMTDAINTLKRPYHRKRLTETMRSDLLGGGGGGGTPKTKSSDPLGVSKTQTPWMSRKLRAPGCLENSNPRKLKPSGCLENADPKIEQVYTA